MRAYMIIGLGLLIGLGTVWAGEPGATENGGAKLNSRCCWGIGSVPKKHPHHVVYVVDCSGSMLGSFDLVRSTVTRSIGRLHVNQQFRLISFGGQSFEPETQQLVWATRRNKIKAAEFIWDVQPQGASDPIPALERAFKALSQTSRKPRKPRKVVYLITDGDFFDSEKVLATIRSLNEKKDVVIFTFQCGHRSSDAEKVLKAIAQENDGKYRLVGLGQAGDAKASSQPASAPSEVEAFLALVRQAVHKRPEKRGFRGGQRSTGLDFSPILASTGQYKALASFPEERGKQEEAISALAKERKAWPLAALLNHGDVDVKIRSARALVELADPQAVPALLAAAKANNYPVEGSESATIHSIYRRTLKEGLEKITDLKLTPKGLRITEYPKPGEPRVITSDDHPERFTEEVDFAKVEGWLTQKYTMEASTQPTSQTASAPAQAMLKELNLRLAPIVPIAKHDFLSLWAYTGKAPPGMPSMGEIWLRPDASETRGIIDALAATGVLETLVAVTPDDPVQGGYVLTIRVGRQVLRKSLGWDASMRGVLETIVDQLPADGHAAEVFHEILERLEPLRAEWDKAAGLKASPIDWDKAGNYAFGPWRYSYRSSLDRQGKVIGHWGKMIYRGKSVEGINLTVHGRFEVIQSTSDGKPLQESDRAVKRIPYGYRYFVASSWEVLEAIDTPAAASRPATQPETKLARVGAPPFLVRLPQEGVYETGDWRYEYRQSGHQRHNGRLTFKDKLIVGAEHYDRVETPWGTLIYLGPNAGFLPTRYRALTQEELRRGHDLTPPEGRPTQWATGVATQPVR